jgi:hypothetical protein
MHSRDAAEEILGPYMDLLAEPFPAAWKRWADLGEEWPDVRRHLSPRARAGMVHDWAAARARLIFADLEPDVRLHEAHGFLLLGFHDQLYLRLKKFQNQRLLTSGIQTQQQMTFAGQQPLVGFPSSTNLVLGYQLNEFQTDIGRMAITCTTFSRRHWLIDVPLPGQAVVTEHPILPAEPGPTQPSIRPKDDREERGEAGS